jgi:hypothetical protein
MAPQTKSPVKIWSKPRLERLGKIADVAGNAVINNNGSSPNLRS